MTQHPLADALREAEHELRAAAPFMDASAQGDMLRAAAACAAALSQYEKSDTDRDQLREELLALKPHLPEFGFDTFVSVPEPLIHRILAALASKTAIDPVTVERCAQVAESLPTDWRDGTQPGPSSAYRHAAREIAAAIRALGKDQ